jgi:uncharacterized membrane protein YhaH (DUF805 family)
MSTDALDGKTRSKLREAILAGFNPVGLDEVLRDNDMFRHNIAIGPDFETRVNSLIDVARQEGWLLELCGVLAAARAGNQPVSSAILAVQKWLSDQRQTPVVDPRFREHAEPASQPNAVRFTDEKQTAPEKISWAEFFFSFSGRVSRGSFWLGLLIILVVIASMYTMLALLLGEAAFDDGGQPTRLFKNIYWLMGIPLYWPIFALIVKRLHDFGQGKALAWLFFVLSVLHKISDVTGPESLAYVTLAVFMTVQVVIGCVRGISGPNEYGPDPLPRFRKLPA